jgi:hypothetical protein
MNIERHKNTLRDILINNKDKSIVQDNIAT